MNDVTAHQEKLTPVGLGFENKRRVTILESLTILFLVAVIFWSVGPLIEEWGMFHAFNDNGLGYFKTFAPSIPMRPLHLVAYALQWVLGDGKPVGVAAGTALLMVVRYFVTRWAVSPLLGGYDRWVVATLAATFAFWPGAWLGRYGPAQLSAVLFFVALGFAIRLSRRWSFSMALGCAASIALMLATYQGLTLCLLAIPVATLLWRTPNDGGIVKKYYQLNAAVRASIGIAGGFFIYAAYWIFISSKLGNAGYEGELAGDGARLLTFTGLWNHVGAAYTTAYVQEAHLLPLLFMVVFFLCGNAVGKLDTARSKVLASVLILVLVFLLPVLSLIYVNALHIRDLDRVLFPVFGGFVLVCLTLLNRFRVGNSTTTNAFNASAAVLVLFASSVLIAGGSRHYVQLERTVLDQTWEAAQKASAKTVLIRDVSGLLGDVYTLYVSVPNDAMAVLGRHLSVSICTPMAVDRLHPISQRFPITSTPRCEELPAPTDASLVLTAKLVNNALVLEP